MDAKGSSGSIPEASSEHKTCALNWLQDELFLIILVNTPRRVNQNNEEKFILLPLG